MVRGAFVEGEVDDFGIKMLGKGIGFEIGVEEEGFDEGKIFENNLLLAELFEQGGDVFDVDGIAIGFGIGLEFEVIGIDTDTDGIGFEIVVGKFEAVVTIGGRLINEVVAAVVVVVVVVVDVLVAVMGKV